MRHHQVDNHEREAFSGDLSPRAKRSSVLLIGGLALAALASGWACAPIDEAYGHAITLEVRLEPAGDQLQFVSPAGSIIETPVADIVGKPWYCATFEAGFSSGNDLPLYEEWGTVPESLSVDIANPAMYAGDAAYDVVFVVYVNSEAGPDMEPPAAVNGDLATFTIDQSVIREGDPQIVPGVVRVVVGEEDAVKRVENRIPEDLENSDDFRAAMTDTVMIVP